MNPLQLQLRVASAVSAMALALFALAGLNKLSAAETTPGPKARLIKVQRIWDQSPHNAFTDLVRFHDRWFCVFREGQGHVSPDGSIRVLTSPDGDRWSSAAQLTSTNADLRDPKITITPEGRLLITAAGALHPPSKSKHQSMTWFSNDGEKWDSPNLVADPNLWLWRVSWHHRTAYAIGYDTGAEKFVRLYSSADGKRFTTIVPNLLDEQRPNESAIVFLPDQSARCLLRRDGQPGHGLLGLAKPPYTQWEWKDLGRKIGGPAMVRLPDGRLIGGVRLYDGKVRTALISIDADSGATRELLSFPSGGDCSYPGLVWHENELWISYYSSHEGRTSIYLARARL